MKALLKEIKRLKKGVFEIKLKAQLDPFEAGKIAIKVYQNEELEINL